MIRIRKELLKKTHNSRKVFSNKTKIHYSAVRRIFSNSKSIRYDYLQKIYTSFKCKSFDEILEITEEEEVNSIQLLGRLTKDPELKTSNQTTYCRFSIAVPRGFGKNKETDFFNCTAFGKTAEAIAEYVHKGDQLCVQGRMEFTTKDKVTYHNVSITSVTFISNKNNSQDVEEQPTKPTKAKAPTPPDDDDDEYPF